MILFLDGNYETGAWLTKETYPGVEYYVVDEGSPLAAKIFSLQYRRLIVENGELVDVEEREPTPEEVAAAQPQKSAEEKRIEQLEADNIALMTALADVYEQLLALQTGGTT